MVDYQDWIAVPSSRDLPDLGIKPSSLMSPALAGRFFTPNGTWEACSVIIYLCVLQKKVLNLVFPDKCQDQPPFVCTCICDSFLSPRSEQFIFSQYSLGSTKVQWVGCELGAWHSANSGSSLS